jgi:hypothetical protein
MHKNLHTHEFSIVIRLSNSKKGLISKNILFFGTPLSPPQRLT